MLSDPVEPTRPSSLSDPSTTDLTWFRLPPDAVRHRHGRWHARGLLPPTEHTVFASCGIAAPLALAAEWIDDRTAMEQHDRCTICTVARVT